MAPGGEEGEVEVGDGSEAGGDHDEVAQGVAADGEGGAGGSFQQQPFAADECGGVAAADGGD